MIIQHSNRTSNNTDEGIMYWSVSGFGITYGFFMINLVITLVGFVIITLNAFVIYFLLNKPRHWDASCLFIINLAISDTMLGAFTVYNVLYNLIHYKNFHECLFRFGLLNSIIGQSNLSIFALSVDRYVKIISPHIYVWVFQEKYANIYTVVTWVFSAVNAFLPLFGWNQKESDSYCGYFGVLAKDYLLIMWTLAFTIITLICVMYIHILILALSKIKQTPRIYDQSITCEQTNKMNLPSITSLWWKPTKTVLIIVTTNIICLIPVGLYSVLMLSETFDKTPVGRKGTVLTYLSPLLLLNSLANPIIYAFKIPDIKKTFQKKFCKCLIKSKNTKVRIKIISSSTPHQCGTLQHAPIHGSTVFELE